MAIALRASTSADSGLLNATTLNFTIPAATVAGDVMYVQATAVNTLSGTDAWATPTGWVDISGEVIGDNVHSRVFRRVAQVGDANSALAVTFNLSRSLAGVLVVLSGADTTTPEDVSDTTNTGQSSPTTALGLTTVTDAALSLMFIGHRNSGTGDTTLVYSTPTNYTAGPIAHSQNPGPTRNAAAASFHREIVTAGATGDVTATHDSGATDRWATVHVAVRPAAGGTQHVASGTVAATSTATGSVAARLVAGGVAAAVTSVAGVVAAILPSSGTVAATSTASGNAERLAQQHPASGTVVASSAAAGTVTALLPTSGVVVATSTVTGDAALLPGGGFAAAGTVAVVSAATGAVTARLATSGQAASTSGTAGALTALLATSATLAATSAVSGNPTALLGVAGTIVVVSGVSGDAFNLTAYIPDPDRTHTVPAQDRTSSAIAADRTHAVPQQSRTHTVPEES